MITIILTYRNRDLDIVKKCFNSLQLQTNNNFQVCLIDYGSTENYAKKIKKTADSYKFISLMRCETTNQLWCKSRAINIALKQCDTPYVFVGDIDMIYHNKFMDTLYTLKHDKIITYFQVGFLNETESRLEKPFEAYPIKFKSNSEATGMTLYPTEALKAINGYDEFYHGWGSEDTDVHIRLKCAGYDVKYYKDSMLILHQWHTKTYRTKDDITPFHSTLEQINSDYLKLTKVGKKIKANLNHPWGAYYDKDYDDLAMIEENYMITNKASELSAFFNNVMLSKKNKVIHLEIKLHEDYKSLKQKVKKVLGKKTLNFNSMYKVNDLLLENIITYFRSNAYNYIFDEYANTINLTIKL